MSNKPVKKLLGGAAAPKPVAKRATTPIQVIADLERRAKQGDISAKVQLRQVLSELEDALMPMPTQEMVGDEGDTYPGEGEAYPMDELDHADLLKGMLPAHIDELEHKARVKEQMYQQQQEIAPTVSIAPASAFRGNRGNITDVQTGQKQEVAIWYGDERDSIPCTLTLSALQNPVVPNAIPAVTLPAFRPFAIVQFGTRALNSLVEVDIGRGVQFTLGANNVSIQVALEDTGVLPSGVRPSMKLGGMISFYTTVRTTPLIRSRYVDSLATGTATFFQVPPFAVEILPIQTSDPAGSFTLAMFDSTGAVVSSLAVPAPGAQVAPIPLSGDVYAIALANTGVAPVANFRIPFALSF